MNVKLEDAPFTVEDVEGKPYVIADPLELIIELATEKLLDGDDVDPAALPRIREKVMAASKIPSLTYTQTLAIIHGITAFAESLQKKIASKPTSSPATAMFQTPKPNASAST
jgi:hypothetical protein